jgi:hypothetical protein
MVGGRRGVGGSFFGDVWSRHKGGPTHVGRRQPVAIGAEQSAHGERCHWEQGGLRDQATISGGQN